MKPRKRTTKDWEGSVKDWLKRHDVPEETITLFMPFIWRKVIKQELTAMRDILKLKGETRKDDKKRSLSELIAACGEEPIRIQSYWKENDLEWQADTCGNFSFWDSTRHKAETGPTPEQAVEKLLEALKMKGTL